MNAGAAPPAAPMLAVRRLTASYGSLPVDEPSAGAAQRETEAVGSVIARGAPADVLSHPRVIASYLGEARQTPVHA